MRGSAISKSVLDTLAVAMATGLNAFSQPISLIPAYATATWEASQLIEVMVLLLERMNTRFSARLYTTRLAVPTRDRSHMHLPLQQPPSAKAKAGSMLMNSLLLPIAIDQQMPTLAEFTAMTWISLVLC